MWCYESEGWKSIAFDELFKNERNQTIQHNINLYDVGQFIAVFNLAKSSMPDQFMIASMKIQKMIFIIPLKHRNAQIEIRKVAI